jgi:hypothetical protein
MLKDIDVFLFLIEIKGLYQLTSNSKYLRSPMSGHVQRLSNVGWLGSYVPQLIRLGAMNALPFISVNVSYVSLQENLITCRCSCMFPCCVLVHVHGGCEQMGQGFLSFIVPYNLPFFDVTGIWHNISISEPLKNNSAL